MSDSATETPRVAPATGSAVRWNRLTTWLAVSGYWLAIYMSSRIQVLFGGGEGDGLAVIAAVFFAIIILCMLTEREDWSLLKRAAFIPASFAAHAILTVPVAAALGILMYDADRVRTVAEQRGVFVLASLPVLAYAMWRSRLFVIPRDETTRIAHTRPTEPSE